MLEGCAEDECLRVEGVVPVDLVAECWEYRGEVAVCDLALSCRGLRVMSSGSGVLSGRWRLLQNGGAESQTMISGRRYGRHGGWAVG